MESIQKSLKQWTENKQLQDRLKEARNTLVKDSIVRQALEAQEATITEDMIERALVNLYEYKKERTHCGECPGLSACPNMMKGYQPKLTVVRQSIELSYHPCEKKMAAEQDRKQREMIKSFYVPKEILSATFDTLEHEPSREEASRLALSFSLEANPGEDGHGLYFYGKFGVGKTYLMGAVANELKDRGVPSFLVYTPDFFREMKQSIGDGTFQEKIDIVKRAPVLILDDIGAETISAWVRDDVLGVILQYRMLEKLPTLFTSNYDYEELERHLSYSDKGGIEELKAKRIMERVKHFTSFVKVEGTNRRKRL